MRTVVTTPFGMLARDSGQTVHQTSAGFAGQWKLPEAGTNGLQYNWHRHYDPTLGRYTQPDPLGLIDGPSRYGYALQNPVRFDDPRGENAIVKGLLGWLFKKIPRYKTPPIVPISPKEFIKQCERIGKNQFQFKGEKGYDSALKEFNRMV